MVPVVIGPQKGVSMAIEEEKKAQTMRLRRMREALGYNEQKDFANALGITKSRWGNMETGGLPISKEVAEKIVKKFPILSIDYVLKGDTRGFNMDTLRLLGIAPAAGSSSSRD
jgi:transcriptional regulator with XRE-family HTH domain